ncbi:MAG TPA: hypothetical protein VHF27_03760 [Acidimicrobiales bacterium]|nr:hypothetical protein [Acidimicrobiales bacterium]
MPLRRSLVGVLLVVAAACSGTAVDDVDPLAAPPTSEPTTTTSSTTTTTTVPLPPDLQDLIATTTMTERARRLFLAATPAVEDPDTFAHNCGIELRADPADGPRTHTHGCYVAGRIHLRAPDRPEARELLYVVAAHELLHAVYASLGPADRNRIDAEVAAAGEGNPRLEERLKPYGSAPTLANEAHAILGSEFDGLSPALEAHYAQYFSNRSAVVAVRQRTLGAKEDEIERLRGVIDDLDARITYLRETQETLRTAGDISRYNANVPVINGLIGRYNDAVDALNAEIDAYNGLLGG